MRYCHLVPTFLVSVVVVYREIYTSSYCQLPCEKKIFIIIPIFQNKKSKFEEIKLGVKTQIFSFPGKEGQSVKREI